MKFRDLQIQTQRESPNNARTQGFSLLVRAGYLTRENMLTALGAAALDHLRRVAPEVLKLLPAIGTDKEMYFPIASGDLEVAYCSQCKYTEPLELARFTKVAEATDAPLLPLEKIATPDCNTIDALSNLLGIPKEKTAKAMMHTRISDGKLIFSVIRGDMQLSDTKLKSQVGDARLAMPDEIIGGGAVPGYASPIGLKDALIIVDDLIPESRNLVSGANEMGYHLLNTNYGRDYSAEIVTDLTQAKAGDPCVECGNPLEVLSAMELTNNNFPNILLALAETFHDENGLNLPHPAAPFDVYLLQISGKELDTRSSAEDIYTSLNSVGISVLFDERDERAGVKFNDADLIGCPIRITVGERGLKEGMVELKLRNQKESKLISIREVAEKIRSFLS